MPDSGPYFKLGMSDATQESVSRALEHRAAPCSHRFPTPIKDPAVPNRAYRRLLTF